MRRPSGREHGRVDDHVAERDLAHELEAREDHPVLPEADDLARGRLQVAGVERCEVGRLVGPAERRERPERRGEPGVEHVRRRASARSSRTRRTRPASVSRDGQVAVRAVPDRELVAPPELARDAPVGRVLERVDREAVLRLRVEADRAARGAPRAPAASAPPSRTTTGARSAARSGSRSARRARPRAGRARASRAGRAPRTRRGSAPPPPPA